MAYFLSFYSLIDELEQVTFLSLIVGLVIFLLSEKTSLNLLYI